MTVSFFSESSLGVPHLSEPNLSSVISVQDELVRGSERALLNALLPRIRKESLALDLSGVERIDAAGIAALIELYCAAGKAGTDFSVVTPSAHVREMLRLVGLEPILVQDEGILARCVACPAA